MITWVWGLLGNMCAANTIWTKLPPESCSGGQATLSNIKNKKLKLLSTNYKPYFPYYRALKDNPNHFLNTHGSLAFTLWHSFYQKFLNVLDTLNILVAFHQGGAWSLLSSLCRMTDNASKDTARVVKNHLQCQHEQGEAQQMVRPPRSPDLKVKSVWDYIKREPKETETA